MFLTVKQIIYFKGLLTILSFKPYVITNKGCSLYMTWHMLQLVKMVQQRRYDISLY